MKITLKDGVEYEFHPLPFTREAWDLVNSFASGEDEKVFDILLLSLNNDKEKFDVVCRNFTFADRKNPESDLIKIIKFLINGEG